MRRLALLLSPWWLAACTTLYPTPKVDFDYATAPSAAASGPRAYP